MNNSPTILKQRNQFDATRTHATAATPTCCCSCCCVITAGISSLVPAEMLYYNGRKRKQTSLLIMSALFTIIWPLSIGLGVAIRYLFDEFSYAISETNPSSTYYEQPTVRGIDTTNFGVAVFVLISFGIVFTSFFLLYKFNSFWITPVYALSVLLGCIVDIAIAVAIIGGAAGFNGNGEEIIVGVVLYSFFCIGIITFVCLRIARRYKKPRMAKKIQPPDISV